MKRPILALATLALLTAGCLDSTAEDEGLASETAPDLSKIQALNSTAQWPLTPTETVSLPFDVDAGATRLEVVYNWRGQYPTGTSRDRAIVLVDPDGTETPLLTEDLPVNPYVCLNPRCGPADDRDHNVADPQEGTWALELRGAYTATATLQAYVTAPAGGADEHDEHASP